MAKKASGRAMPATALSGWPCNSASGTRLPSARNASSARRRVAVKVGGC